MARGVDEMFVNIDLLDGKGETEVISVASWNSSTLNPILVLVGRIFTSKSFNFDPGKPYPFGAWLKVDFSSSRISYSSSGRIAPTITTRAHNIFGNFSASGFLDSRERGTHSPINPPSSNSTTLSACRPPNPDFMVTHAAENLFKFGQPPNPFWSIISAATVPGTFMEEAYGGYTFNYLHIGPNPMVFSAKDIVNSSSPLQDVANSFGHQKFICNRVCSSQKANKSTQAHRPSLAQENLITQKVVSLVDIPFLQSAANFELPRKATKGRPTKAQAVTKRIVLIRENGATRGSINFLDTEGGPSRKIHIGNISGENIVSFVKAETAMQSRQG